MLLKVKNNGVFQDLVIKGISGSNGKSAYQSALDTGYEGTEAEWVASLKGADGKTAVSHTVTVATSAWAANTSISGYAYKATVSVTGVTASSIIIVGLAASATAEIEEACSAAGVQCKGQGSGTIDLYAKELPEVNLDITVLIL